MLHLIIGPVGAGKSTYARELATETRGIHLNLDRWMATLYGDDERPVDGRIAWYRERVERCLAQIWDVATLLEDRGVNPVLELGLVEREARERLYSRVDAAGLDLRVHVIDAPRDVRWARVEERNRMQTGTFAMAVPQGFFDLASDLWEPPDEQERADRDVTDASSRRP